MSYIGNSPLSIAFLTDTFSGTGSATAFTMTVAPANTSSIIVAITGVLQDPSTYSVSGTTLTFSAAPPSGTSNISVRYLGIPASGVTTTAYRTVTEFTATSGQTSFSVPSYTVGYIDVYRNGVMLGTADFTATTGTTVVLGTGATTGDLIRTESFYVSSVLNAIPATNASVQSSYLAANLALSGNVTVSGSVAPSSTAGIIGTTTNNDANAGSVGEYVSSYVPNGSAVSVATNGTTSNITSISLTAGDWDVSGVLGFTGISGVSTVLWVGGNASSTSGGIAPAQGVQILLNSSTQISTTADLVQALPVIRFSLSTTTTIYLVQRASYTTGTIAGFGLLRARRIR